MTKAPLGGEATGPNPTDRAKQGVKRSLLADGAGIPIGLAVGPANRNDHKLMRETLDSRPVLPPPSTSQHMCLDKGYDYLATREVLEAEEFVAHIRSRGEEARAMERNRKRKARRWVVERLHSWMNRFRRLLVRWEKKLAQLSRPRPVRLRVDHLSGGWALPLALNGSIGRPPRGGRWRSGRPERSPQ